MDHQTRQTRPYAIWRGQNAAMGAKALAQRADKATVGEITHSGSFHKLELLLIAPKSPTSSDTSRRYRCPRRRRLPKQVSGEHPCASIAISSVISVTRVRGSGRFVIGHETQPFSRAAKCTLSV